MNRKILLIIILAFSIIGILLVCSANKSIRFDKLTISSDDWSSIIEERKSGEIYLKNIKFNEYDLVIDEKNNKIYYSIINNSSSKFLPQVSYFASGDGIKLAILDDEITEDKISNNHEFKVILYNNEYYKTYGLYCTSFPMLNIVYDSEEKNDNNIPMSIYLFNNFENGVNRIVRSDGILDIARMEDDSTNYKFSLLTTSPNNNEIENVISLLHMKPSNEYFLNLVNSSDNTSPLNNRFKEPFDRINLFSGDKEVSFDEKRNSKDMPPDFIKREKEFKDRLDFSGEDRELKNIKDFKEKNDFSGNKKFEKVLETKERMEQRVELFINNEYVGLYELSYNPDIRIKPRNK